MRRTLLVISLWQPAPADGRSIAESAARAAEQGALGPFLTDWRARSRQNPRDRAALLARGLAASYLYQFREADSLLSLAAAASDDIGRQSHLALARHQVIRGEYRVANQTLLALQRASVEARDSLTVIDVLLLRAGISRRVQSSATAAPLLDSAEAFGALRRPALAASLHCRRAGGAGFTGDWEGVRRLTQLGIRAARTAESRRLEAACHFVRATTFARRGMSDSLGVAMDTTMTMQRASGDLGALAAAQQWLGFYMTELGRHARASRSLTDAWTAARASGSVDAQSWTALSRAALASSLNHTRDAQHWMRIADSLMTRTEDAEGLRAIKRMQANTAFAVGDTARGWQLLDVVEQTATRSGDIGALSGSLATRIRQALNAGDTTRARVGLARWEQYVQTVQLRQVDASIQTFRGELALLTGQWNDAVRSFDESLRLFHVSQHYVRLSLQIQRALALGKRGDLDEAARAAADAESSHNRWRASITDSTLRLFTTSVERTADYHTRLVAVLASSGRIAEALRLSESRRARRLREQLAEAAVWSGVGSRSSAEVALPDLAQVQRSLPDSQTAIIEYLTPSGSDSALALVIAARAAWPVVLPPLGQVSGEIPRLLSAIEGRRHATTSARVLGRALLDPLLPALRELGIKRLVISPDAALHLVPFEMLRITGDVPLLQQFSVSYVPSVAVAHALWTAEPLRAGSVLAIGDPRTPMGALPGARQEVVQIARRFPGTVVRMGPAASEALIKRPETGRVRLLHVGAHGVVNAWDGREAALQLTPGDGEDGVLFAGEIAGLALNGAVVVLSACQTNTGEIIDGEGVQGLTSAFLRAGARTVITTGWRIPDRDIVRLVDEFYARVASGRVVGEALREAQLASMTRGDPPQVWAAFRIVGDATRSLPSR